MFYNIIANAMIKFCRRTENFSGGIDTQNSRYQSKSRETRFGTKWKCEQEEMVYGFIGKSAPAFIGLFH